MTTIERRRIFRLSPGWWLALAAVVLLAGGWVLSLQTALRGCVVRSRRH